MNDEIKGYQTGAMCREKQHGLKLKMIISLTLQVVTPQFCSDTF